MEGVVEDDMILGVILPVMVLRMSRTREEELLGEKPTKMPSGDCGGTHLGIDCPFCRDGSRTYTGHSKTCT